MKKSTILCAVLIFSILSCRKEVKTTPPENQQSVITEFKELASVILQTAKKNPEFRTFVYKECYKQKFGDYYVKLSDLMDANELNKFWDQSTQVKLQKINTEILKADNRALTIFIPSIENDSSKATESNVGRVSIIQEPLGAIEAEYNANNYTCPGYNSGMAFIQYIDESFAWNNDVWVFGQEEDCDAGNMVNAPENFSLNPNPGRYQGQSEYGVLFNAQI